VIKNLDPFTDHGMVHIFLQNESDALSGVTAVSISCNTETRDLWVRVLHSYMIGDDDANRALLRFGSGSPQTLRGMMATDNEKTDFVIKWADLAGLADDPSRLAVRFTDLGDGDSYDAVWSDLDGTTDALRLLAACSPGS
jgi:hypothetical protein